MEVTTTEMGKIDTITPGKVDAPEDGVYHVIAGIFIAIFLVGIVGNSIVIYVLFRKRKTWNITTTYLFNLSIADAVFVCTLPLWAQAYLNQRQWNFGVFLCKLVGITTSLNMYASIFFLTAMSVDRWIAVVHATTVNTARSSVVARIMCIVVWVLAFLISIPRLMYQNVSEHTNTKGNITINNGMSTAKYNESYFNEMPRKRVLRCGFLLPLKNRMFFMGLQEVIQALVGFMIPMTIICICYLRIVRTVRMKLISKRVRKERVALLAGIIVSAFFICWLPAQLMTLYSALAGWWKWFDFDKEFFLRFYPFFVCLAYANSCINPFVYAFTATNFKNNVKEVCGSNISGRKQAAAYKMALVKDNNRPPFTPDKATNVESKKPLVASSVDPKKKKSEDEEGIGKSVYSSSDDIYEPFNPNRNIRGEEKLGGRGPPECQHLAIQDTTSGIYYEYFSSPPVFCRGVEGKDHKVTTRADIINHNNQPEISDAIPAEQSVINN